MSPTLINVYTPASIALAVENVSNPNVSLNDFINTYLNRLSTVNNEFQIINITDGTLAGKPAKIIVSEEMDILNHISKVMRTLTLSDGIVYKINYQAEPNQFSSYMPVAQKMINSYEIANAQSPGFVSEPSGKTNPQNQGAIPSNNSSSSAPTNLLAITMPKNLIASDNSANNAQLPLRFIAQPNGNVTETKSTDVPEGSLYGYNPLLMFHFVERPNMGIVKISDLIMGQIKTYDSLTNILENS